MHTFWRTQMKIWHASYESLRVTTQTDPVSPTSTRKIWSRNLSSSSQTSWVPFSSGIKSSIDLKSFCNFRKVDQQFSSIHTVYTYIVYVCCIRAVYALYTYIVVINGSQSHKRFKILHLNSKWSPQPIESMFRPCCAVAEFNYTNMLLPKPLMIEWQIFKNKFGYDNFLQYFHSSTIFFNIFLQRLTTTNSRAANSRAPRDESITSSLASRWKFGRMIWILISDIPWTWITFIILI